MVILADAGGSARTGASWTVTTVLLLSPASRTPWFFNASATPTTACYRVAVDLAYKEPDDHIP